MGGVCFLLFQLSFMLIKLFLMLLWLPFKILVEIAEHSGRRRHHARRRRAPAPPRVRMVQPRTFPAPRPASPAIVSPRPSISRNHKVLAIILGSFVLLSFVGLAAGAPTSHRSPRTQTSSAGAASVSASGLAAAHHSRHHGKHRKHRHHVASGHHSQTATSPAASSPTLAGCYPMAASGNCYEPGEFCPDADAGVTGVAGDGERIICEDNNGLRWEPV